MTPFLVFLILLSIMTILLYCEIDSVYEEGDIRRWIMIPLKKFQKKKSLNLP